MSLSFDALILGNGIAGVSAALRLSEQKKTVAIFTRGAGATALGSGSWDFGRVPPQGTTLEALLATLSWPKHYANSEGPRASVASLLSQLEPYLPHSTSWEQPFLLPSMSGALRRVFCAQTPQTRIDFSSGAKKRYGLVSARSWRFRSDFLARQFNEQVQRLDLPIEVRAVDIPLISKGVDIPLSRVAADLHSNEAVWESFSEAIGKLSDSLDGYLFPPIFPNYKKFEELSSKLPVPLSEILAWLEPTPGFRLAQAFKAVLEEKGVSTFDCESLKFGIVGDRLHSLQTFGVHCESFEAGAYVLATGRFIGGGLVSSRHRVSESVFDLPLTGEGSVCGIRTDSQYRPLSEDGMPAFQNLSACGTVLAGVDYFGEGVGMGFAVSTGRACVASVS
jgi:glycerol-3-phosphate dehydrogenase subunit B